MALELPEIIQRVIVDTDISGLKKLAGASGDAERAQKGLGSETDKTTSKVKAQGDATHKTSGEMGKLGGESEKTRGSMSRLHKEMDSGNRKHKDFGDGLMTVFHRLNLAGGAAKVFTESIKLLKAPTVIGAIEPLIGGISSLAGEAFALGSSLSEVSGLVGVIPAGFLSLGLAAGTAKVAFGDIGKELTQLDAAAKKGPAELAKAMEALGPATRQIVGPLMDMRVQFKGIKEETRQAFIDGGLVTALNDIATKAFPVLRQAFLDTGRALGTAFKTVSDTITSNDFLGKFAAFAHANEPIIRNLGAIIANLASAFLNVALAAQPVLQQISDLARVGSAYIRAYTEVGLTTGSLADYFQRAYDKAGQIVRIIRDVAVGIGELARAVKPFGDTLLDGIEKAAEKFRAWAGDSGTQARFVGFLNQTKPVVTELFHLVGDLVGVFFKLADEGGARLAPFIARIRTELLPVLTQIASTVSQGFLDKVLTLVVQLAQVFASLAGESGPLTIYVEVLTTLARALNWLIQNVPGVKEFVFLMGVLAATFKITASFGFVAAVKDVVKSATDGVGPLGRFVELIKEVSTTSAATSAASGAGGLAAIGAGAGAAAGLVTLLGVAIGGVVLAFKTWRDEMAAQAAVHKNFTAALANESSTMDQVARAVVGKRLADAHQVDDLNELKVGTEEFTRAALGNRDAMRDVVTKMLELGGANGLTIKTYVSHIDKTKELSQKFLDLVEKTGKAKDAFQILNDSYANHHGEALVLEGNKGLLESMQLLSEETRSQAQDFVNNAIAQGTLTQSQADAIEKANTYTVTVDGQNKTVIDYAGVLDGARKALEAQKTAEDNAAKAIEDHRKAMLLQIDAERAQYDASFAVADAQDRVAELTAEATRQVELNTDADDSNNVSQTAVNKTARDLERAYVDLAQGVANQTAQQEIANGVTINAEDKQRLFAKSLQNTAATMAPGSPIRAHLEELADAILHKLPDRKEINIEITGTANLALDVIMNKLQNIRDKTIHVNAIGTVNVNGTEGAAGAILPGGMTAFKNMPQFVAMASGGFMTTGPTFLVGEGKAAYPEYVIPTDPAYRANAIKLLDQVVGRISDTSPINLHGSATVNAQGLGRGTAVHIETAVFQSPVDVDLLFAQAAVHQRTRFS